MPIIDGFTVTERTCSDDASGLSVGLANLHAAVPDIEANKDKVLRTARVFRDCGVNIAVFPEFTLSGYFWDDRDACLEHVRGSMVDEQRTWIQEELEPLLGGALEAIVFNGLTSTAQADRFLNRTFILDGAPGCFSEEQTYDKIFLPGIETGYTDSGRDDRLVLETRHGRLGFTTCYDYLFAELLREYALTEKVDAIVQLASWRAAGTRDYPRMNVRTDSYYGDLWDMVMCASSAAHQVWTIACNAVGTHALSGARFWGGTGVWAPSGLCLVQASHTDEELVVVHGIDLQGEQEAEKDDFDYAVDFREIYRPLDGGRTFTRAGGA